LTRGGLVVSSGAVTFRVIVTCWPAGMGFGRLHVTACPLIVQPCGRELSSVTPAGSVSMVMDTLFAHKSERVRELIEVASCEVLYLPPYSPDLNPIEAAFSKIKGILRKAEART
jgi:hypothetical protein